MEHVIHVDLPDVAPTAQQTKDLLAKYGFELSLGEIGDDGAVLLVPSPQDNARTGYKALDLDPDGYWSLQVCDPTADMRDEPQSLVRSGCPVMCTGEWRTNASTSAKSQRWYASAREYFEAKRQKTLSSMRFRSLFFCVCLIVGTPGVIQNDKAWVVALCGGLLLLGLAAFYLTVFKVDCRLADAFVLKHAQLCQAVPVRERYTPRRTYRGLNVLLRAVQA